MQSAGAERGLSSRLWGRSFVHPVLEYLLVGGGLSLAVTALVFWRSNHSTLLDTATLAGVVLASNSSHFAASTVRLYSKPGSVRTWPFLTMLFPLVALSVLTLAIFQSQHLGSHLQALYLSWSPFHYAAQAYGLAVVYSHRSGCRLSPGDKRLLRGVALLPFFYALLTTPGAGLFWFLSKEQIRSVPVAAHAVRALAAALPVLGFLAPAALYLKIWRSPGGPMPLIGILAVLANGVWWFVLPARQAFVWATVFHGLQYLVIVIIFHVKDRVASPENRHGWLFHTAWFYGTSLLLGYGLFYCLPWAYSLAGFGMVESMLLVVAAINVHHFVVDAYIWKLRPGDSNRRVVEAGVLSPAY